MEDTPEMTQTAYYNLSIGYLVGLRPPFFGLTALITPHLQHFN